MKLKLFKINEEWYQVLEVSNLYDNKELYEENITVINNITFLHRNNYKKLHYNTGRPTISIHEKQNIKDYSNDAFLTKEEFITYLYNESVDYFKNEAELEVRLKKDYSTFHIQVQTEPIKKTFTNVFMYDELNDEIVYNYKIPKLETNIFTNNKVKTEFLNNSREEMIKVFETMKKNKESQ